MSISIRWLARLLALVATLTILAAAPASAQNDPMSGFFRFLFGGQQQQQRQPQRSVEPADPGPARVQRPRAPAEPKVVEKPKDSDSQVVLVLGDSQGSNLAQGLQAAFADEAAVTVNSRTRGSLAIVRDDEYDLAAQLPAMLSEGRVDFIVIMSGVNDRQSFYDKKTGAKTEELKSDRWEGAYRNRIATIVKILRETGKPVFWVGQPPTERPTHSAFMGYINGVVKPIVEEAGATFVDVWPGFTDDEGNFTYSGPDVDGKERRLRASDGIHFTRAGQRKLAFFVEQGLRDLIKGVAPAPEPLAPEAPTAQPAPQEAILAAPPPLPPAPWRKVGPVIAFDKAPEDADAELAGGPITGSIRPAGTIPDALPGGYPITETPLHRRLVRGEGIEAPSGRIDDFKWPQVR